MRPQGSLAHPRCLVEDLFSRRIVGWGNLDSLRSAMAVDGVCATESIIGLYKTAVRQ